MFTKFHSVSFIASTVTGLEVEQNELHINTTGESFTVRFKTKEEALSGLEELTEILNGKKKEEPKDESAWDIKDTLKFGIDRFNETFGNIKSAATDKVQEAVISQILGTTGKAVSDIMDRKDELMSRAAVLLSTLEAALDNTTEEKPMATRNKPVDESTEKTSCFKDVVTRATSILDTDGIFTSLSTDSGAITRDTKKITTEQFKEIFATESEPLIGDMSERQLREFIGEFVDNALANDRVQQLFQNIKDNFGTNEAEEVIEGYKKLILTIALQNTEMTLSDVISRYFS